MDRYCPRCSGVVDADDPALGCLKYGQALAAAEPSLSDFWSLATIAETFRASPEHQQSEAGAALGGWLDDLLVESSVLADETGSRSSATASAMESSSPLEGCPYFRHGSGAEDFAAMPVVAEPLPKTIPEEELEPGWEPIGPGDGQDGTGEPWWVYREYTDPTYGWSVYRLDLWVGQPPPDDDPPPPPVPVKEYACCPEDGTPKITVSDMITSEKTTRSCQAKWKLDVAAKFKDEGTDEEGHECKCECCELRQFVYASEKVNDNSWSTERLLDPYDPTTNAVGRDFSEHALHPNVPNVKGRKIVLSGNGEPWTSTDPLTVFKVTNHPVTVVGEDGKRTTQRVTGSFIRDVGIYNEKAVTRQKAFGIRHPYVVPGDLSDRMSAYGSRAWWLKRIVEFGANHDAKRTKTKISDDKCNISYTDEPTSIRCTVPKTAEERATHADISGSSNKTIVVIVRPAKGCHGEAVGRVADLSYSCSWKKGAPECKHGDIKGSVRSG